MRKKWFLVLLFSSLPIFASAQYQPYAGQAIVNSNGLKAAPFAQVTVYTTFTSPTSCSGSTIIYQNQTGSGGPLSQPIAADQNGNYFFFTLPGIYAVGVQSTSQSPVFCYPITIGSVGGIGNNATVIDLTQIPGYQTIAANDLAQLYADGEALCGSYPTCVINGLGLTGASYPWTTWGITGPLAAAYLPGSSISKTVDNFRPMIIRETSSTLGPVKIIGAGKGLTVLNNSTDNDAIVNRSTTGLNEEFEVDSLSINTGSTTPCGFSTAIDSDAGIPDLQNSQVNVRDVGLQASRFGIREDTGYFDYIENPDLVGCQGVDIEGGNGTVINAYGTVSRAGIVSSTYWQGSQWIASENYTTGQLTIPRSTTVGWIYAAQNVGVSGSTPPAWCTTLNCTVTDNTETWKAVGQECYEWWPSYNYPAGACIQDYPISGGHTFSTVLGGVSGTSTPPYVYTGGTFNDGAVVWQDNGAVSQNLFSSDPASFTWISGDQEINSAGDGFDDIAGGTWNLVNVGLSLYANWGLNCPGGCGDLTWTGGGIGAAQNVAGAMNLYNSTNLNFTNLIINGTLGSGANTGTGIAMTCNYGGFATNRNFIGVNVTGWTPNTNYPSGCVNTGFNQLLASGGLTADGPVTAPQYNTSSSYNTLDSYSSGGSGANPLVANTIEVEAPSSGIPASGYKIILPPAEPGAVGNILEIISNPSSHNWMGGWVGGILSGATGTITGTSLSATCDSGTASVTGAAVGSPVIVSSTTGADVGGAFNLRGSVTSTGTVTVYVCGTGTPASLAYNVRVLQ